MMVEHGMREAIRDALGAHAAWKQRLKTAVIDGRAEITPDHAGCDDRCAFGRWLHGADLGADIRQGEAFRTVKRLHAEFHQTAAEVLATAQRGDRAGAEALLEADFEGRSQTLKRALMGWLGALSRA